MHVETRARRLKAVPARSDDSNLTPPGSLHRLERAFVDGVKVSLHTWQIQHLSRTLSLRSPSLPTHGVNSGSSFVYPI